MTNVNKKTFIKTFTYVCILKVQCKLLGCKWWRISKKILHFFFVKRYQRRIKTTSIVSNVFDGAMWWKAWFNWKFRQNESLVSNVLRWGGQLIKFTELGFVCEQEMRSEIITNMSILE